MVTSNNYLNATANVTIASPPGFSQKNNSSWSVRRMGCRWPASAGAAVATVSIRNVARGRVSS
jgi:hypothetical protein